MRTAGPALQWAGGAWASMHGHRAAQRQRAPPRTRARRPQPRRAPHALAPAPSVLTNADPLPSPPFPQASGDLPSAAEPTPMPAAAPVAAAPAPVSFGQLMAFSGPAPELINGRLAMLGGEWPEGVMAGRGRVG